MDDNIALVPSPAPESPNPGFHALTTGNPADDDGQALDDYFEPAYNGPVASESYDLGVEEVKKPTRIISNQSVLSLNNPPSMILPADPNRLHVFVISEVAVRVGSDSNEVRFAGALLPGVPWHNDYHTGAVWVLPYEEDGIVNVWAVTE